jgi:hypothetical protein
MFIIICFLRNLYKAILHLVYRRMMHKVSTLMIALEKGLWLTLEYDVCRQ